MATKIDIHGTETSSKVLHAYDSPLEATDEWDTVTNILRLRAKADKTFRWDEGRWDEGRWN